jgi:solute carrier family 35 protein F5
MIPFACVLSRQRHRKDRNEPAAFQGIWSKMGFYLPLGSIWKSRASYRSLPSSDLVDAESNPFARLRQSPPRPSSIDGRRPRDTLSVIPVEQEVGPPLDLHQTAGLAANFMIVWFLANYCLNVSLKLTSVASATTLSSASGFFTLAIGSIAGVEAFSLGKLLAVFMSFMGVLLVTRADSSPNGLDPSTTLSKADNPYLGDLLALSSAFFYAVYVVMLKKRIGDESRVSMPLFFGFVGIFNIALMWPVGLLLHFLGIETLQMPSGSLMWTGVLVNMSITFVSDMAYLLAMLKSSPLVATVGLSLTIPLAILGDTLLGSHTGGTQSYAGSIIVLISFVGIGLADRSLAGRVELESVEGPEDDRHPSR